MNNTPGWKTTELLPDGFFKFDRKATDNLISLISEFNADIILISTHRISYSNVEWCDLFKARGINAYIERINDVSSINLIDKITEIVNWVSHNDGDYIIIDDDVLLGRLPDSIKSHWVKTSPLIGFDDESLSKARIIASKQI